MQKPALLPKVPHFSSGPCAKRPGWTPAALQTVPGGLLTGRSHRSQACKNQLLHLAETSRRLLDIPADYKIAYVAGSDTGAFEAVLWQLLGPRPVDTLAFDVFGRDWLVDITQQLRIPETHPASQALTAPFGELPDLAQINPAHDLVFTWSGTTAGVAMPDGKFLDNRGQDAGLVFCDAISAIFAMEVPFQKMDVVSWSWQKGMGGEAQHGMIAFSPRALERLLGYIPNRPLPKIFRLANWAQNDWLFTGDTINTPSMLCVADALDALRWIESIGGRNATIARTNANAALVGNWIAQSSWAAYLATDPILRAPATHCLHPRNAAHHALPADTQRQLFRAIATKLEVENAAFDIVGHRDATPCLRLWTGPTVETSDVSALLPWLDWAYAETAPSYGLES